MNNVQNIWLLDFDGVINAPRPTWRESRRGSFPHYRGSWSVQWAPRLVSEIRAIHASGAVQIIWCSSWCENPRPIERLLGLPRFDTAFKRQPLQKVPLAKVAAARKVLNTPGQRLIWTDDGITPTRESDAEFPGFFDEMSANDSLLIRPNKQHGLTHKHIKMIRKHIGI